VSLIGKLEQISLALVLQGIEKYAKTGLLVVRQDAHRVELYFRDGRLMCIGPVRPQAQLADRLLKAGVVSPQVLHEALTTIGLADPGETRIALTLMDLGYVSHEDLRAWAAKEASEVLQVLFAWPGGDLYFDDGEQPPHDRLLVALSPAALLPPESVTAQAARIQPQAPVMQQTQQTPGPPPQAKLNASQLVAEPPAVSPLPAANLPGNAGAQTLSSTSLTPPQRVDVPKPPMRIDTSFMRPEMVLLPIDLSALRQQNPRQAITPEHWRILTRVDGQSSLQSMCLDFGMPAEYVCQLAGELIALGLIRASMPIQPMPVKELSPVSHDLLTAGLANGYVAPGYAASPAQPWMYVAPTTDTLPPAFNSSLLFETKSQWGNGGNGATFVPGRGWIPASQPLQPVPTDRSPYAAQNVLVNAGGRR
jgi:hypothetical protein